MFLMTFLGFVFLDLFLGRIRIPQPILLFSFAAGIVLIVFVVFLYKLLNIKLDVLSIITAIIFLFVLSIFCKIKRNEKLKVVFKRKIEINDLILIIIFWLSVFSRIYPIKDLIAPLEYDPIAISTISRLIVDNQGIPDSWNPYMPTKLSYPPGFPSIVAWYNILSNVPIPTIILFFTNFIQALLPLAVYGFALALLKNKFQSFAAAIITLIAVYPIFDFTIGMNSTILSYFLTVIVLAIVYFNIDLKRNYNYLIFLFTFSVSSFLVYSLYPFYLLLIILPLSIKEIFKDSIKFVKKYAVLLIFLILFPLLFTLSYYSQFYTKKINQSIISIDWTRNAAKLAQQYGIMNIGYSFLFEPFLYALDGKIGESFLSLSSVSIYDLIFVFIFLCSIFIILKNRIKLGFVFISIYIIFIFFSNILSYANSISPIVDKMPMLYYVKPSRIGHFIFFPVSLIFSYFFLEARKFVFFKKLNLSIIILALILIIGLVNIVFGLSYISTYTLVSTEQKNAFDWINNNTSKNSTILNFAIAFESCCLDGDSGQWIPAFTGRNIIFPAISTPEDINMIELYERLKIMELIENGNINTLEFRSLLKKFNINYIFLTDRHLIPNYEYIIDNYKFGKINPNGFLSDSNYKLVFQSNQTYIFRIIN